MKRILVYLGFALAGVLVVAAFITAHSYNQLILAVVLYPPLIFFAYKIFIKGYPMQAPAYEGDMTTATMTANGLSASSSAAGGSSNKTSSISQVNSEKVELAKVQVEDIDKRTFLKLIGAAGLSFFVFSILGRGLETLLYNKAASTGTNPFGLVPPEGAGVSPTQGYSIAQIDDTNGLVTYYGFVNQNKSWFIMKENLEDNSYRYARGKSNFVSNWQNRVNLNYDFYYNQFN